MYDLVLIYHIFPSEDGPGFVSVFFLLILFIMFNVDRTQLINYSSYTVIKLT